MKWWGEYVSQNPMTVEMRRFRNRFFTPGRMNSFNTLVLILGAIGFFILTLIALSVPQFGAESMIYIEMVVICILVPAMTHGTIAAEREKRTWDVLMTAPVSQAQVVIGKFIGAASGIFLVWSLFWVPMLLAYLNSIVASNSNEYYRSNQIAFWALLMAKLDLLFFGFALAAFCILISSRCRRAFTAFFTSFGAVFFCLVVLPAFASAMMRGWLSTTYFSIVISWHPFFAVTNAFQLGQTRYYTAYDYSTGYDNVMDDTFMKAVMLISPLVMTSLFTVIFLIWAIKTIRFIDFDTRFLPRTKNAASK